MSQNSNPNKPNKHDLRDAQARHQSALFGGQAPKPSAQQAETESKQRSQALDQAASQKQQQLTPEETQKLQELQAKSRAGAQAAQPTPDPVPEPAPQSRPVTPPDAGATQLHQASRKNDLAAAALTNMQRNLKQNQAPAQQPPQPQQPVQPAAPQPTQAPAPQPAPAPRQPAVPAPRGSRPAPNPEELDKLLREMAQRSAARRSAAGQPPRQGAPPPRPGRGPERVDAAPVAEAPPEPSPEIQAEEEKSPEKQAEILRELKSREATAQRDIKPIPQADQERAAERSVEATVPIRTEGNAVSAAPLHAAIADLQSAMRAHDAPDQVTGVNQVQRNMPNHPLYNPNQESHGA